MEPHGRHKKSSAPHRMSWRAGMQGSEPVWWRVNRVARAAKRSSSGVSNSVPPYDPSMWRLRLSSSTTTTLRGSMERTLCDGGAVHLEQWIRDQLEPLAVGAGEVERRPAHVLGRDAFEL